MDENKKPVIAPSVANRTKKNDKKKPKKGKKGLVIILILLLLIGGMITVFALNLFDLREGVIMPYLRNMPLVGGLFPPAEEEDAEILELEQMTPSQLASIIRSQRDEIAALQEEIREYEEQRQVDALHIARLRPFQQHWLEYQRVAAEFNAMIALGDPEAYLSFIEYILPEFYEQLAQDAALIVSHNQSVMDLVRTLGSMRERNAAAAMEDLLRTDTALLVSVLNAMSSSLRGAIMDEMEPSTAAIMLRFIFVPEPTLSPLAPALATPVLPETLADIPQPDDGDEENGGAENGDDE